MARLSYGKKAVVVNVSDDAVGSLPNAYQAEAKPASAKRSTAKSDSK
jgi:hypothetical protein